MGFQTTFYLSNKHLQTSYATFFRKPFLEGFEVEDFTLNDGDFIQAYWYNRPKHSSSQPIAVLFHGLAGSYKSPYIQGCVQEFDRLGFASVVVHFRGCADKENLLARSYHSGETQDNLEYLTYLHKYYKNSQLFCVGFSLGGNMLLKLLGEIKQNNLITAAVAVSAPMQLNISAKTINTGFAKIYQRRLLNDLKLSLLKKYEKHDIEKLIHLKKDDVKKIKTIKEFDQLYTAPIHGFLSADDYYEKCSAKQFLKDIKIPTLIIHAKDDPFMTTEVIPNSEEISVDVVLEVSENGGHVGFINGALLKPEYWLEKRVGEYFSSHSRLEKSQ